MAKYEKIKFQGMIMKEVTDLSVTNFSLFANPDTNVVSDTCLTVANSRKGCNQVMFERRKTHPTIRQLLQVLFAGHKDIRLSITIGQLLQVLFAGHKDIRLSIAIRQLLQVLLAGHKDIRLSIAISRVLSCVIICLGHTVARSL